MNPDVRALIGGAVGGAVGYLLFAWLSTQGFYALILPGSLIGFGTLVAAPRSIATAIVCAIAAIPLGLFTEWRYAPFVDDDSFGFFLKHIGDLQPWTLLMIFGGAVVAFWVPYRRRAAAPRTS